MSTPGGALQEALEQHAVVLLVFCVRRTLEVEAGLALWAETIAQSQLAARRLRTTAEAVAWLDAMAYRQLARFRATGRADEMGVTEDIVRARVSRGLRDAAQSPGAAPAGDALAALPALQSWLQAEPAPGRRAARA